VETVAVQPVLRPPAPPVAALQLSLALYPLAAPAQNLRLASAACTPARPVANLPARIGFVSFGSTGCVLPTCADCSALPTDWWRPLLACAWRSFLQLGRQPTSDSHRCRSFAQPAASSGLRLLLPLHPRLVSAFGLLRLLSPYGFSGRRPFGLRLTPASPVELLMHSLFPPNLASPAEPSMSIPFPLALASSEITQLNYFRLASALVTSGASSDPSAACAPGFNLCPD